MLADCGQVTDTSHQCQVKVREFWENGSPCRTLRLGHNGVSGVQRNQGCGKRPQAHSDRWRSRSEASFERKRQVAERLERRSDVISESLARKLEIHAKRKRADEEKASASSSQQERIETPSAPDPEEQKRITMKSSLPPPKSPTWSEKKHRKTRPHTNNKKRKCEKRTKTYIKSSTAKNKKTGEREGEHGEKRRALRNDEVKSIKFSESQSSGVPI